MTKSIVKYEVSGGYAYMPENADIFHGCLVEGRFYIWAWVDHTQIGASRGFELIPNDCTVANIENLRHLITMIGDGSNEDWHLFEKIN